MEEINKMVTIKEILNKYNITIELPQKFEEIQVVNNTKDITDYHQETHDGRTVHIFTDNPDEQGITTEYILDPQEYKLTILIKKNDEQIFGTYKEYKYDETINDIQITQA